MGDKFAPLEMTQAWARRADIFAYARGRVRFFQSAHAPVKRIRACWGLEKAIGMKFDLLTRPFQTGQGACGSKLMLLPEETRHPSTF
jgi:hypothetical protein